MRTVCGLFSIDHFLLPLLKFLSVLHNSYSYFRFQVRACEVRHSGRAHLLCKCGPAGHPDGAQSGAKCGAGGFYCGTVCDCLVDYRGQICFSLLWHGLTSFKIQCFLFFLLLFLSITCLLFQTHIVDPHGLAIHYIEERIYWIDRTNASYRHSVLRSCNFDGTGYTQRIVYRSDINNHTVSTNVTDLVIDYLHNNTAFFIDQAFPAAIIATNLNSPVIYNNATAAYEQFINYYESHVVLTTLKYPMQSPEYLLLDEENQIVMWSDPDLRQSELSIDCDLAYF